MNAQPRKASWTASGRKDVSETDWINAHIRSRMDFQPWQRVVDIGCGDGTLLASIAVKEGVGVTPETDTVSSNAENFPHLRFSVGTSENVPVEDGWADRVILNGVLPVLNTRAEMLQSLSEAARILKPGGLFWLGEVRGPYNPEIAIFGSVGFGKFLRPWLSLNKTYFKHFRKAKKLVEGKAILLSAKDITDHAATHGLSLIWQEPSYRFIRERILISPIRRDYQFKKS